MRKLESILKVIFKYVVFGLFISSCVGVKESRKIRSGSKIIRDSKTLLLAHAEGSASFINLAIRDNNFFTIDEGVMFWWDYYAGTWTQRNDTIFLDYIDGHQRSDFRNFIVIENGKILISRNDSLPTIFLEIQYDNLRTLSTE